MSERDEFEAWLTGGKPSAATERKAIYPGISGWDEYRSTHTAAMWSAWKAARAPQGVPEGWKMVPLEPSVRMLAQICNLSQSPSMRYAAMLAAAPQPSQEPRKYQD